MYNRLYWNYTLGINAGEVIYALNYNIQDENGDGVINAADAEMMYPMGHGDAYGHYLTALGNYYSLLMNPNFDWVPHVEAVSVLGATVSVNYQDERKFASTGGGAGADRPASIRFDMARELPAAAPAAGGRDLARPRVNSGAAPTSGATARPIT